MKKLIFIILIFASFVSFAQVKDYEVQAVSILQADDYFVWKNDTIRKDSIVYVENHIDSIRVKYINGTWSKWIKETKYEIATFADALAGILDNKIITPLKLIDITKLISVPYINAVDDVELGDKSIKASTYKLNTAYVPTGAETSGTTYWDAANKTFSDVLENGVIGQRYEEQFISGQNNTGATIANGKVVQYSSSIGNSGNIRIQLGIASSTVPSFMQLGIVTEPIIDGQSGKVTTFGKVRGIQTNGVNYGETWIDGDILYVSTTTAGALTKVEPQAPYPAITVAVVISAHATNGTILVRPTFPQRFQDSPDVNGTPLIMTGQIPVWDQTNSYFDFNYNITGYQPLHGIYNRSQSTLSYNNSTQTVSITPVSTTWRYYNEGQPYDKTTVTSTHSAMTGMHYLYYDSGNNLQFGTTPFSITTDVMLATVYYNSTLATGILLDERHSAARNRLAHQEFHNIIGAYKVSGFGIDGYVIQPTSPTDANNTFSLTSGVIADEDIQHQLSALADAGPYKVFYKSGASGVWTWESNNVPYTWGTSYIEWNEWTGTTWQLTQGTVNDYINVWVGKIGAVDGQYQTAIIVDQDEHADASEAMAQKLGDMDFSGFPLPEFATIYKITFQINASYTSTGKCRIYAVTEEVKSFGGSGGGAAATTAHNSLTGIDGGEIGYYGHLNTIEKARLMNFKDSINSNEIDPEFALDSAYIKSHVRTDLDKSITNELNTSMGWNNSTNEVSVVDAGGTKLVNISGFADSTVVKNHVDNATIHYTQSVISIPASQISDFDTEVSNNSSVVSNTAKVTNATHTGDATGSTALTLATVNSNIGTYNNVTINAKGLATAGSNVAYITSANLPVQSTSTVKGISELATFIESLTGSDTIRTVTPTQLVDVVKMMLANLGTDVINEDPNETPNGSLTAFTVDNIPIYNTVKIQINGLEQAKTLQYSISGSTITFVTAPRINDTILITYKY